MKLKELLTSIKEQLKKIRKVHLIIYSVITVLYIVALAFFTHSLLLLEGVETLLRVIVISLFWILIVAYMAVGLLLLIEKKRKTFVFTSFFLFFLIILFIAGTYFIRVIYREIDDFSQETVIYKTNLIALNNTEINENSPLGMISDEDDVEGHELAIRLMARDEMGNEIVFYDDFYEMISDLYKGVIDGLFVSANFGTIFGHEDAFNTLEDDVFVVAYYADERALETLGTSRGLNEPFTLLIIGVDARSEGRLAANADTLMLVTFNPQTLTSTMLSLPRDLHVPIACRNNAMAKINSSAARGVRCVIDTVEQLTEIEIDHYVVLNFRGMVALVDAIGGIEVDVVEPDFSRNRGHDCRGMICSEDSMDRWGNHMIFIEPGLQTLNGEQALAYSRNRYQFRDSDLARNRHQQQVMEAIIGQVATIRDFSTIREVLNILGQNMDTNLSANRILSFYSVGRDMLTNRDATLTIQRTLLEVYGLRVFLPGVNIYSSALGFHQRSLDEIINAMKVNLGLREVTLIKNFSYSFGENYEVRLYGAGLRNGTRTETMPNFVGQTRGQAEAWLRTRGIAVSIVEVNPSDPFFDATVANGRVLRQSVHQRVLLSEVRSVVLHVIRNTGSTPPTVVPPVTPDSPEVDEDYLPDELLP